MTNKQKKELYAMVVGLTKRIDRGIAFLDKRFGRSKWLKDIDESKLDLGDGDVCMTGQLYTENWDGFLEEQEKKILGKPLEDFDDDKEDKDGKTAHGRANDRLMKRTASYGFYLLEDEDADYDVLTRLWHARLSVMKIEAGLPIKGPPPVSTSNW